LPPVITFQPCPARDLDRQHHASPLHDIGKVGIRDSILPRPSNLSHEKFEAEKTHAALGARTWEAVRSKCPGTPSSTWESL
jgi:response regulator RpfG family c-di-GMP phosphodiesterase